MSLIILFDQKDQANTERPHDFMPWIMSVTLYKNPEKVWIQMTFEIIWKCFLEIQTEKEKE